MQNITTTTVTVSTKSLEDKIVILAKNFKENAIDLAKHCYEYYRLMQEDKPQATRDLMRLTQLNKASVSQLKKAGEYYFNNPSSRIETSKAYLLADMTKDEQKKLESKSVEAIREFKRSNKAAKSTKTTKATNKTTNKATKATKTNNDIYNKIVINDIMKSATIQHDGHTEYSKSLALKNVFDIVDEAMIDTLDSVELAYVLRAVRYLVSEGGEKGDEKNQ